MSAQAADALMSIFGFERVTLQGDDESGTTAAHGLLEVVMSDKMREEFENRFPLPPGVWWGGKSYLYTGGVDYSLTNAIKWDLRFEAWAASRAALVVELPVIIDKDWACTSNECSAMRDAIRFCAQKIHAAGVKTK